MDRSASARDHVLVTRDGAIGMANYIIHENTWTLTPVCYLEDLFVDPKKRAACRTSTRRTAASCAT